ncbi:glycosyl transferase [Sulfuricella sp. T08]|nr:glycosyl transferase [Sulfuricella sp. T08]
MEIIPMGVDLAETFTPPVESGRSNAELLFVGRLVEQKGVQYLIMAMPEILKKHPRTTLVIAGDGPERENLLRQAAASGVGKHVRFLGAMENATLSELYGNAAIFVSPSLAEGFGLALVEASGCGCPVITTDLPAIRDLVIDEVTGLLCRQADSADLAAKIDFLLEHPELRESMGHAGRQHVLEQFDWETISRRYASLFEGLLRERP